MKRSMIKLMFAISLTVSMTFMSCLKDDAFDNGEIQSVHSTGSVPKIIEIKLTAGSIRNVFSVSFDNTDVDTSVNNLIPVNLATNDPAPQDLHVTLVPNNQLVTDYNANNGTSYIPTTNYELLNAGVVTIPAGMNTGFMGIKLKPSDFFGATYAVGFTLNKIDESGYSLSGNMQNGIIIINIKNEYDGNYHNVGVRIHPSLGDLPFEYDVDMNTVDLTSISGNAAFDFQSDLTLVINPDNTVNVSSTAFDLLPQPGKVSTYDPATKTFTLHYFYNTAAPRLINQTLTRN